MLQQYSRNDHRGKKERGIDAKQGWLFGAHLIDEVKAIEQEKLVEAWLASVPSVTTVEIVERPHWYGDRAGLIRMRSGLMAAQLRLAWAKVVGGTELPVAPDLFEMIQLELTAQLQLNADLNAAEIPFSLKEVNAVSGYG
eukprot:SAG11_NODE_3233_length_2594_cov_9.787976_1_plen_140_part_00